MKYTYRGPVTALALHDAKGKLLWEGALHPGRIITLPDETDSHAHVSALIAAGHLTRLDDPEPASPKRKSTKASKETESNG
jgi:hypothetical protein